MNFNVNYTIHKQIFKTKIFQNKNKRNTKKIILKSRFPKMKNICIHTVSSYLVAIFKQQLSPYKKHYCYMFFFDYFALD